MSFLHIKNSRKTTMSGRTFHGHLLAALTAGFLSVLSGPATARDATVKLNQTQVVFDFMHEYTDFKMMRGSYSSYAMAEACTTELVYSSPDLDPESSMLPLDNNKKVLLLMCALAKGFDPAKEKADEIRDMIKNSSWANK